MEPETAPRNLDLWEKKIHSFVIPLWFSFGGASSGAHLEDHHPDRQDGGVNGWLVGWWGGVVGGLVVGEGGALAGWRVRGLVG